MCGQGLGQFEKSLAAHLITNKLGVEVLNQASPGILLGGGQKKCLHAES